MRMHTRVEFLWGTEDRLSEFIVSLHCEGPRVPAQLVRLDGEHLHLPSHLHSLPPFLPLLIFLFFCLLSYASPYSWLMLNSRASCLSLLRAKITGVSHATWLL